MYVWQRLLKHDPVGSYDRAITLLSSRAFETRAGNLVYGDGGLTSTMVLDCISFIPGQMERCTLREDTSGREQEGLVC